MPTTRAILDLLTPDELAHLNQRHGIKVDRRTKAHLLDRLEEKGPDNDADALTEDDDTDPDAAPEEAEG